MARREMQLRPETPTRALLRRVQKRSSAGNRKVPPPPLPTRGEMPTLKPVEENSDVQDEERNKEVGNLGDSDQEEEEIEALVNQFDQMHHEANHKDARIAELEAQLKEAILRATLTEKGGTSVSGGLTRVAAAKLEREFASQERILQGLQKDNEAKTIEVERLRREKKTMADHLARQYGSGDWESVVFGSSSLYTKGSNTQESDRKPMRPSLSSTATEETQDRQLQAGVPSMNVRSAKSPLGRVAKANEGATVADSSFYSADETLEDSTHLRSSSPVRSSNLDLSAILSLIEAQRLLIKGFERTNALKMVECQDIVGLAREREEAWKVQLATHSGNQSTIKSQFS